MMSDASKREDWTKLLASDFRLGLVPLKMWAMSFAKGRLAVFFGGSRLSSHRSPGSDPVTQPTNA